VKHLSDSRHFHWHSLGVLLLAISCAAQRGPDRPLPLDPLSEEEKHDAVQIALADARVKEMLGTGRHEAASVSLFPQKLPREQVEAAAAGREIPMSRTAEVIFFRYEDESGVRVIVDLSHKSASEVSRLSTRDVPMTQTDLAEAWNLASRNAEVRETLGAELQQFQVEPARQNYRVEGLRIEAVSDKDPCYKHRCLQLLFRRGADYLVKPIVIVDLTSRDVRIERRER
jgi:Cu2+-containing amine oxidase